MADPYGKLSPGQRIEAFPAILYNAMIDTVRTVQRMQRTGAPDLPGSGVSQTVVKVRNDSGIDLMPGGVLELSGAPVFAAGLEQRRRPVFAGVAPTSTDPAGLVILVDAIESGSIGRAVIAGAVACQVQVGSAAHAFAAPVAGQTDRLLSAPTGPLRILHRESGTGTVWALVSVGGVDAAAFAGPPVVRINGVDRDSNGRYRGFLLSRNEAYAEDDPLAYSVVESIAVAGLNGIPLLPDREYFARRGGMVTLSFAGGSGSGSGSGNAPVRLYTVENASDIFEAFITSTTAITAGSGSGSGAGCARRYHGKITLLYPSVGTCGTRFTIYGTDETIIHVTGSATPSTHWPISVQYKGQLTQATRTVTCSAVDHTVPETFSIDLDALTVTFDDHNGSPVHRTVNLDAVTGGALAYDAALLGWAVALTGDDGADWLFTFSPCGGATVRVEGPNATYNLAAGESIVAGSTTTITPPTAWEPYRLTFDATPFASDAPGADPALTLTAAVTGAALAGGTDYYETLTPICCTPTGADDAIIDDAPPELVVTTCCPDGIPSSLLATLRNVVDNTSSGGVGGTEIQPIPATISLLLTYAGGGWRGQWTNPDLTTVPPTNVESTRHEVTSIDVEIRCDLLVENWQIYPSFSWRSWAYPDAAPGLSGTVGGGAGGTAVADSCAPFSLNLPGVDISGVPGEISFDAEITE